jgi:hypothetical protein
LCPFPASNADGEIDAAEPQLYVFRTLYDLPNINSCWSDPGPRSVATHGLGIRKKEMQGTP